MKFSLPSAGVAWGGVPSPDTNLKRDSPVGPLAIRSAVRVSSGRAEQLASLNHSNIASRFRSACYILFPRVGEHQL